MASLYLIITIVGSLNCRELCKQHHVKLTEGVKQYWCPLEEDRLSVLMVKDVYELWMYPMLCMIGMCFALLWHLHLRQGSLYSVALWWGRPALNVCFQCGAGGCQSEDSKQSVWRSAAMNHVQLINTRNHLQSLANLSSSVTVRQSCMCG